MMPFKDPERRRAYQRERYRKRKSATSTPEGDGSYPGSYLESDVSISEAEDLDAPDSVSSVCPRCGRVLHRHVGTRFRH